MPSIIRFKIKGNLS